MNLSKLPIQFKQTSQISPSTRIIRLPQKIVLIKWHLPTMACFQHLRHLKESQSAHHLIFYRRTYIAYKCFLQGFVSVSEKGGGRPETEIRTLQSKRRPNLDVRNHILLKVVSDVSSWMSGFNFNQNLNLSHFQFYSTETRTSITGRPDSIPYFFVEI